MTVRPLSGLRVADFTWYWAGPFCTRHLGRLGAEVIKLENPAHLDMCRLIQPMAGEPGPNRSGCFNDYNQEKRSLAVNLATPEGRQIALDLVARSDVAIENFSPGVMEKLGLGYDALRQVNPSLVMVSISGYGDTGPLRANAALGLPLVFASGLASVTGYGDGIPQRTGISYGDPNGGLHAMFALLAALWHRKKTGQGQHVKVALLEALLAVIPDAVMFRALTGGEPAQLGNRHPHMAPHGVYRTRGQDHWIAIAAETDEAWRATAAVLGLEAASHRFTSIIERKQHEDELDRLVGNATAAWDRWELARALQARGVAAFPVLTCRDVAEDPHLTERCYFTELAHPEVGVKRHSGIPWTMRGIDLSPQRPAPQLGEANDYVLRDLLGYPEARIAELRAAGVIT